MSWLSKLFGPATPPSYGGASWEEHIFQVLGVPFGEAKKYDRRFEPPQIACLYRMGVPPPVANSYNRRFHAESIPALLQGGITPVIANGYSPLIPESMVMFYYKMGLTPDRIPLKSQEKLLPVLEYVIKSFHGYILSGVGTNAVVVNALAREQKEGIPNYKNVVAYKVAGDLERELQVLEKIKRNSALASHPGAKNIVSLRRVIQRSPVAVVELEYIPGMSLEEILDKHKVTDGKEATDYGGRLEQGRFKFSAEATIRYGSDIFNALQLLHLAGIYHRDLWLGNVLLHKPEKRAVVIDFDIATEDATEKQPVNRNRRYGGENDVQSLGQMMYRMCVGSHIFNPTVHLSTHWVPEKIKAERERIYADERTLGKRLKQVDQTVPDPRLSDLIKTCLAARGKDPDESIIAEKFRKYAKR